MSKNTKKRKSANTAKANHARNYSHMIQVRLSTELRAKYKRLSKKSGLTMSDAFRRYVAGLREGENLA